MKITVDRHHFCDAFAKAAACVATRDGKPILENVFLSADETENFLCGTDTEVGIRVAFETISVAESGTAMLPVKRLKAILADSSDKQLSFEIDQTMLKIKGSRSKFSLNSSDPDEFPRVGAFQAQKYHRVSAPAFTEMLKRTAFATDPDNTKYALGGVLLEFTENQIIAVATDGRRLATQPVAAKQIEGHEAAGSVIVPPRCIRTLGSILGNEGDVLVSVEANHITFQYQGITIFSRLIEGRFPRWEKIVPPEEELPCSFAIMAGALRTGYQQAGIVSTDRQPGVEMTATTGTLKLGGAGAEIGESSIEIPVSYDGTDVTVKLDPKFVIEFAKSLPADKLVTVRLDAAGERPVLFTTDESCRYVVMPLA